MKPADRRRSLILEASKLDLLPCKTCSALRGDPCRGESGKTRAPHKGRHVGKVPS